MAVLKPKNRMVSFRLSEEEYDDFYRSCTKKGAHSLSEFARETICLRVHRKTRTPEERLRAKLGEIQHSIEQLRLEFTQLARTVNDIRHASAGSGNGPQASRRSSEPPKALGAGQGG